MLDRREGTVVWLLLGSLLVGGGVAVVDYLRPAAVRDFRVFPGVAVPPSPSVPDAPSRIDPAGAPAPVAARAGPVNLNEADEAELQRLPGIGPTLAARIVVYRRKIGGFTRIRQLLEIRGIGRRTLTRLEPLVVLDKKDPDGPVRKIR